eukprot:NODE_2761_length_1126_cov_20.607242_g2536_i0.p1 GENE.NODE_2761_length_1126_cov_20.607242_g2536_i0~~NODE_2761_length_1126_cov_20.607242_g2536_i0.p1  ORF type:complete len:348 (+),score=64.05 NODE_2761_length_1126_cov_20.607242_g2536_i0:51-1094(+)
MDVLPIAVTANELAAASSHAAVECKIHNLAQIQAEGRVQCERALRTGTERRSRELEEIAASHSAARRLAEDMAWGLAAEQEQAEMVARRAQLEFKEARTRADFEASLRADHEKRAQQLAQVAVQELTERVEAEQNTVLRLSEASSASLGVALAEAGAQRETLALQSAERLSREALKLCKSAHCASLEAEASRVRARQLLNETELQGRNELFARVEAEERSASTLLEEGFALRRANDERMHLRDVETRVRAARNEADCLLHCADVQRTALSQVERSSELEREAHRAALENYHQAEMELQRATRELELERLSRLAAEHKLVIDRAARLSAEERLLNRAARAAASSTRPL